MPAFNILINIQIHNKTSDTHKHTHTHTHSHTYTNTHTVNNNNNNSNYLLALAIIKSRIHRRRAVLDLFREFPVLRAGGLWVGLDDATVFGDR